MKCFKNAPVSFDACLSICMHVTIWEILKRVSKILYWWSVNKHFWHLFVTGQQGSWTLHYVWVQVRLPLSMRKGNSYGFICVHTLLEEGLPAPPTFSNFIHNPLVMTAVEFITITWSLDASFAIHILRWQNYSFNLSEPRHMRLGYTLCRHYVPMERIMKFEPTALGKGFQKLVSQWK